MSLSLSLSWLLLLLSLVGWCSGQDVTSSASESVSSVWPILTVPLCDQCEWMMRANFDQRALSSMVPLPVSMVHGTHNSFNYDHATGLLIERPHNQAYSVSVQLDMLGARNLEYDPHFLESLTSLNDTNDAKLRVCHIGRTSAELLESACETAGWLVCNVFEIFDYGRDTGCGRLAPSFRSQLVELQQWVSTHHNDSTDVITVFFDEFLNDRVLLIDQLLEETGLAQHVFTPAMFDAFSNTTTNRTAVIADRLATNRSNRFDQSDWPNYVNASLWPTPQQMVDRYNRSVVIFLPSASLNVSRYMFPHEARFGMNVISDFKPASCSNRAGDAFTYVQGDVTKYTLLGVQLDNSRFGGNVITMNRTHQIVDCGLGVQFDLLDVPLASAALWTWAPTHPRTNTSHAQLCALHAPVTQESITGGHSRPATSVDGQDMRFSADNVFVWGVREGQHRFHSHACSNTSYRHACQRNSSSSSSLSTSFNVSAALDWVISAQAGNFTQATCPPGYRFSVPHSPAEARALLAAKRAAGVDAVWINFHAMKASQSSCWEADDNGNPRCYRGEDPVKQCSQHCIAATREPDESAAAPVAFGADLLVSLVSLLVLVATFAMF